MSKKQLFIVFMAIVLVLPSFLVNAAADESTNEEGEPVQDRAGEFSSKDEVVYATLSPTGDQQEIYVVNSFEVEQAGTIVDFGTYSNLKNLTNVSKIEQIDTDQVQFSAPTGKFYYQGNVNDDTLPWDIAVTYLLDGEEIDPDQLAGKDGHVQIKIETSANDNVDPAFFENYLLQISLTLDPQTFSNIETEAGMIANAGKNKQVTFNVMPEQEEELRLDADAVEFELQGMEITAVPSSMSIDGPDTDELTGDMESLTDAIDEINDGVGDLKQGVSDLNDGVSDLADGSEQYKTGISEIDASSGELVDASVSIDEGLTTINDSLQENSEAMDVSGLVELQEGLKRLATGLSETAGGIKGYAQAYSTLEDAVVAIPTDLTEQELIELNKRAETSEVDQKLLATYQASLQAKGTYAAIQENLGADAPTLMELSETISGMGTTLNSTASELATSLEEMEEDADSFAKLQDGLATLSSNYQEFHTGLVGYTEGVSELSSSYSDLHNGITDMAEGTNELEDGVGELHDGTTELQESTSDLPDQMEEEIDSMISDFENTDFEAVSFVSSNNNEKINTVQFVIKTESIEIEEQETTQEQPEETKSFWEKLMDLF